MMYPWITECNKKNGKKMSYNRLALSPGNGIRNEGQNGVWCVCVVVAGGRGGEGETLECSGTLCLFPLISFQRNT